MMNADEMFEEMNYSKLKNENLGYARITEDGLLNAIIFFLEKKAIGVHFDEAQTVGITIQELKAINKKCEELGWIE